VLADLKSKLPFELGGTRKLGFGKKIDEIYKKLYGDLDSVYPISADYDLDSAASIAPTPFYIYADPKKYDITLVVYSRGLITMGSDGLPFSFDLLINHRGIISHATRIDQPITKEIKNNPLQGDGGGGRDEAQGSDAALAYPEFLQLIQIKPRIPPRNNFTSGAVAFISIQGYLLVTRKDVVVDETDNSK
jgi:hypothetical protein